MSIVPTGIRLLLYGYDPVLLETRRLILKMAGFDDCTATDPRSFRGDLGSATEPYELVVICHTVPVVERPSIALLAKQHQMSVFQIESLISPRKLVSEVTRLVVRS